MFENNWETHIKVLKYFNQRRNPFVNAETANRWGELQAILDEIK